ncbi:TNFAIP3-interacting protein 3 [Dendropsophus ebraccatus]|uniref:TNFAIP3-interacting protein 3 n=1 Tax=Dendropsophus ebraccatus TaxID=150705 RepID=UPI0038315821
MSSQLVENYFCWGSCHSLQARGEPPRGQEADKCEISELKLYWNKCLDSERCDSIELNTIIRQQVQQNDAQQDTEKLFPPTRQKLLNQATLSHEKQPAIVAKPPSRISKEEYETRIQILENEKAELLKVNKQWDQYFRYMKLSYENKSKETCNLELHKLKDENYILKNLNHALRKRNDSYESEIKRLNKVLLQVTTKGKIDSISTTVNPSLQAMTSEDFKIKNEVLMHQVRIYEEDFKKEKAEKEMIRKEKEELQLTIQKQRIQLQKNKPDYQRYVPSQLPPDVKQKDTGPSLKQSHKPK